MVRCTVDSITGTLAKVLHELHVTKASLLIAIGIRAHVWGKVPCFVWFGLRRGQWTQCLLLKRCFATLCGYLPLPIMSCGTKEGFWELSSWFSKEPSLLCSWSLSLMAAPVYVDLFLQNCAPPDMESIAPIQWEVLTQRGALLCSTVKLLGPLVFSLALPITCELSYCIGLTRWFIPQQITKHIFIHKCWKLAATLQLVNLRAFFEASYASPPSQRESSLLSRLPCVAHMLCSSAMHKHVGKVAVTVVFPLTAAKTVL